MNTYKTPKTNEEVVLVTYSEIALKSTPVRRVLESQLVRHISNALKRHGKTDVRVRRIQGRLIVEAEDSDETTVYNTPSINISEPSKIY